MSKGKNRLISYVENTQGRLDSLPEDTDDEKAKFIVTSVVNQIKSLCAGAPAEMKGQIKEALTSEGCLDDAGGPNPDAGIPQLKAGLGAVSAALGGAADDDEKVAPPDVDIEPGDETATLTGVVQRLWQMEEPFRLKVGEDVKLSVQHKADFDPVSADGRSVVDRATEPLFAYVDTSKFSPLDNAFMALLDNYKREGDERETVSREEKAEMDRFMDLLDETPHMQYVHKVLVKWDLAPARLSSFMANVFDAWFTNYFGGKSSGFEHVFVGEEKCNRETGKSEIIGLHNWIQFAREEKRGNMNYLGYAHKGPADGELVTVKFAWVDDDPEVEVKTCSTFAVGTSIAFDFSLATLIFFGGKDGDEPWIKLGEHDAQVKLYKMKDHMGDFVRTVFLE